MRALWAFCLFAALAGALSAARAQTNAPAATTPVATALKAHMVQLNAGDDLLNALQQFAQAEQLDSAVILSASGTLTRGALMLPQRLETTVLTGSWNIVSLTGSINRTNAQVQISMSDKDGRTMGGTLVEGSTVREAQIVLGELSAAPASPASTNAPASLIRPPLLSPEVTPDRRVVLRLLAPNADSVAVAGDWPGEMKPMSKDNNGIWSATLGPFAPDVYTYTFVVDELRMLDPGNSWVKPGRSPRSSIVRVPGDSLRVHDFQDVPHGVVRHHTYDSKSLKRQRRVVVYTPPDYDKNALSRYPALYLLHGNGDTEETWTELGRAHFILDNLIATGKAKPMVVIMPDAHALPPEGAGADYRQRNRDSFKAELIQELMPFVESNYRVVQNRDARAVAGLSMGGGQAIVLGLTEQRFNWVGGFSSSLPDVETALTNALSDSKALNERLKLLWFACGKDDFLIDQSRKFDQLLTQKGVKHEYIETDGAHTWPLWRQYLADFLPLLFQQPVESLGTPR